MKSRCKGAFCIVALDNGEKYCPKCLIKAQKKYEAYTSLYEKNRREFSEQYVKFYKSAEWRQCRSEILSERIFCEACKTKYASHCHHIIPLKVDWDKRLDKTNIQALCASCHSSHELSEKNKKWK